MVAILDRHEEVLVADVLGDLPIAVRGLNPQVTFECTHSCMRRWLVFGPEGTEEWLELSSLSTDELLERFNDQSV